MNWVIDRMDQELNRSNNHSTALIGINSPSQKDEGLQNIIWAAAESLVSPDLMQRINAFEHILEYDVIRQLPLLTYLLVTRLTEPDIELRTRIVKALGTFACTGFTEIPISEEVQKSLVYHLSKLRTREIFALLQVADYDKTSDPYISSLLSCSSFAGDHLSQIVSARTTPNEIRCQAARFIGVLGFLDALPTLERLASRFSGRAGEREANLYLELQNAVEMLNAP